MRFLKALTAALAVVPGLGRQTQPSVTAAPGNCSCDSFCRGECAPLNSRSLPPGLPAARTLNLTLFRFTPRSVTQLANTNTGDADGDLGFFVARFALGVRCAVQPTNLRCFLAPWRHVVFARWRVEVDAGFGPRRVCRVMAVRSGS